MKRVIALIAIVALALVPMAVLAAGPQGGAYANGITGKQNQGSLCPGAGQCQGNNAGTGGAQSSEGSQYYQGKNRQGTGTSGLGNSAGTSCMGGVHVGVKNADRFRNQTRIGDFSCGGCRLA
jgi:hypothetical protein